MTTEKRPIPDGGVEKHPAARNAEQLAWAVWVDEGERNDQIYAVIGDAKSIARQRALNKAPENSEVVHIDGPYQDSEPGVWEFEFVTEHRETVVVEAPNEEYAREGAESNRDYRGELIQTVHTTCRSLDVDLNGEEFR